MEKCVRRLGSEDATIQQADRVADLDPKHADCLFDMGSWGPAGICQVSPTHVDLL